MLTNSRCILVVGGAGYIGSHMVLALHRLGYRPIVLDNLSTGHRDAVINAELIVGDMGDKELVTRLFSARKIDAVMHFASTGQIADSVKSPIKCYQDNVIPTLSFLEVMLKHNVKNIIYSSSAAVYGHAKTRIINEEHVLAPMSPYGRSKVMIEGLLKDLARSDDLNYSILRSFNVIGADPEGQLGDRHEPVSHLIPRLLQVAAGKRNGMTIHGSNYPTRDGTCVRDYVHVVDICNAHLLALQAQLKGKKYLTCNLGTGRGYSVMRVIQAVRKITKQNILCVNGEPRPGDPAVLISNSTLAKQELQWQPKYPSLETMIKHAWAFSEREICV